MYNICFANFRGTHAPHAPFKSATDDYNWVDTSGGLQVLGGITQPVATDTGYKIALDTPFSGYVPEKSTGYINIDRT